MIIKSITVKNFRSILNETLFLSNLTALLGKNGAGKSSFLHALNIFYTQNPELTIDDFYNRDISKEINIAVTFENLSNEALSLFRKYIENGLLTVERTIVCNEGKFTIKYHGSLLRNIDFDETRSGFEILDRAATSKAAYTLLKQNPKYSAFPAWSNKELINEYLKKWEEDNPGHCIRKRDDGQFFGFSSVGQGYLGKFTRYIFIPAVREASLDATEGRGSVLTTLMELVVRSLIVSKEVFVEFQTESQKKYEELMNPDKLIELNNLEKSLTETLKVYAPDTEVQLSWLPIEKLNIPMPKADIRLVEDNFGSPVDKTGHGLQRSFILTMLQHLALAQKLRDQKAGQSGEEDNLQSELNILLAIEEPELYQHPNRQKYLYKIFQKLSEGALPGVADTTQVIYTTHSPLFVSIDKVNQVRLLRKVQLDEGKPKVTKVFVTNLNEIADFIWESSEKRGDKFTGETILPRLKTIITTIINEGFFADIVVLVEGEEDRAVILGTADFLGFDFDSLGISVISCNCKNNIDRPAAIFLKLAVPVFLIWDGDKGGENDSSETNKRLLRLLGHLAIDYPVDSVKDNFACFETKLSDTMKKEIGKDLYNSSLVELKKEFLMNKNEEALKNPIIIKGIIEKTKLQGRTSDTIEKIINKIIDLKKSNKKK